MIEIRWHGRGGQGAFTASKILGNAAVRDGKHALSFPSFGPERRGAPIQAYTKISEQKITNRGVLKKADYIVYLDETLYGEEALSDLKEGGAVFVNTRTPGRYEGCRKIVAFDADRVSEAVLKRPVSNTAMLAVLAAKTNIVTAERIREALDDFLAPGIALKNKALMDEIGKAVQSYE